MKKYKILILLLIGIVLGSIITLLIKPLQAASSKTVPIVTLGGFMFNLSKANLVYTNLSYHNFQGFDFSGADLRSSNLSHSNLSGANLSGTILSSANLEGANLTKAIFSNTTNWVPDDFDGPTTCPDGTIIEAGAPINTTCESHLTLTPTPAL